MVLTAISQGVSALPLHFAEMLAEWGEPGLKQIPTRFGFPFFDRLFSFILPDMEVTKVKYVLWAADWERCLGFYEKLFGGKIGMRSEVWSEIVIAGATIGVHGGGEGKRTWTGLSFQVDNLREGISKLKDCGGQLAQEPHDTPEDPLHLAMCIDPEGNEFMMTQKR